MEEPISSEVSNDEPKKFSFKRIFMGGGLGLSGAAIIWMYSTFEAKSDHNREIQAEKADRISQISSMDAKLDKIMAQQIDILIKLEESSKETE